MKFLRLAILPALLFASTVPARAGDEPPPTGRFFDTYDTNADGKVTQDEFKGDAEVFRLLDKNADGCVTLDELGLPADYRPHPKPPGQDQGGAPGRPGKGKGKGQGGDRMKKKLLEMDKDGDHRVSKEEFTGPAELFARLDRNGDGFIDQADGGGEGGGEKPPMPPPGEGMPGGEGMPPEGGLPPPGATPGQGPGGFMGPDAIKERWKAMDTDGDGKVSKEEYTGRMPFEKMDSDSDGYLTDVDLKNLPKGGGGLMTPEMLEQAFKGLDKNGDGKLDATEAMDPEKLKAADADGDGAVSLEEFRKAAAKRMGGRGGQGGGPGQPGQPGGAGGRAGPGVEILRRFDKDKDGHVTRDEFPGSDERFTEMDKDGDGCLTDKDFPAPAPGGAGGASGDGQDGAGGAPAGDAPGGGLFAALDKDRNGKLSREEFAGGDEDWRRLDKNEDGWLTPDEAGGGPPPVPDLASVVRHDDKDGDGRVSRDEFTGPDAAFDALDRDHNGFLDKADAPVR